MKKPIMLFMSKDVKELSKRDLDNGAIRESLFKTLRWYETIYASQQATKQDYEHDILVLALRLIGEDPDTFSSEVAEVMMKWEDKVKSVLAGEHVYEL